MCSEKRFQPGNSPLIESNNREQTVKPLISSLIRALIARISFGAHSVVTLICLGTHSFMAIVSRCLHLFKALFHFIVQDGDLIVQTVKTTVHYLVHPVKPGIHRVIHHQDMGHQSRDNQQSRPITFQKPSPAHKALIKPASKTRRPILSRRLLLFHMQNLQQVGASQFTSGPDTHYPS